MKYPLGPRVKVHVTRKLLTKAVVADSSHCYIAEAIKEAVPSATHVAVDLSTTRFTDPEKGLRYVYLTPYAAQLALIEFDEGTVPEPFTCVLKNAHVSRAGDSHARKERTKRVRATPGYKAKRKTARQIARDATLTDALKVARVIPTENATMTRVVGGRRPPQLKMLRKFGVRVFRGNSLSRKATLGVADAIHNATDAKG